MNSLTAKLNSLVDYKIGDTVKIKYWDRSLGSIVEEMITLKQKPLIRLLLFAKKQ